MKRDYATYHVGLKILLRKNNEYLFLRGKNQKRFDFPGGRIDTVEHKTPIEKILDREIKEELGNSIKYKLGIPAFFYRRHFPEKKWHVFIVVYEAKYISGEIELSNEHSSLEWINPKNYKWKEEEFVNKEEFQAITKYLKNPSS